MDSTARRGVYKAPRKGISGLFVALILLGAFAVIFYKVLLNAKPVDVSSARGPSIGSIEKLVVEEVEKVKESRSIPASTTAKGQSEKNENFTFYRTLTRDIKKPMVDPGEELARSQTLVKRSTTSPPEVANRGKKTREPDIKKETVIDPAWYSVQLASFDDFGKAEEFKRSLDGKGYRSFIVAAAVKDAKTWYRVRMGKFKQVEEAKALSAKVSTSENMKPMVVKE